MPLLAEFDPTQKTREENLTLQRLEMDADAFAVGQGLTTALGRAGDPTHVFPPRLASVVWNVETGSV